MPSDTVMQGRGWGDRNATHFERDNIVTLSRHGTSTRTNKVTKPLFMALVDALVYEKGEPWLTQHADEWGYANRDIRNASSPSYHAWGLANDYNATTNPSVTPGHAHHTDMPNDVAALCHALGLAWGGSWHDPYDPMHFECELDRDHAAAKVRYLHSPIHYDSTPSPNMPTGVLQKALVTVFKYDLKADSLFGRQTDNALRDFQRKHRLPVDGVAHTTTWHALGFDQS